MMYLTNLRKRPVAKTQEMVIVALALLCYFVMVAFVSGAAAPEPPKGGGNCTGGDKVLIQFNDFLFKSHK